MLTIAALVTTSTCLFADAIDEFNRMIDQVQGELSAGQYEKAATTARQMRAHAEKSLKDTPSSMGFAVFFQGRVLADQRRYAEATPLLKWAYERLLKSLGEEDQTVAAAMNSLAEVYRMQRQCELAEPLYKRSLAVLQKLHGPQALEAASAMRNLALLYEQQERYAEAISLYERVFQIRKRKLGSEHPATARSLIDIADIHRGNSQYDKAESFYKQALEIQEEALGAKNITVASTLYVMGELYRVQDKVDEAKSCCERSLAIRREKLPAGSTEIASCLNTLGLLHYGRGQYDDARRNLQQAANILEAAWGPNDPDVAGVLNNLAEVQLRIGDYEEAETLFHRALKTRQTVLGPEHHKTAETLNSLGLLKQTLGQLTEAERFYEKVLEIWRTSLSTGHPKLAIALNNLASVYGKQTRYKEAEPLLLESLALSTTAYGSEHSLVAMATLNLGNLYRELGKNADAERVLQEALRVFKKLFGPRHPEVAHALEALAMLYQDEGRDRQATSFYRTAIEIETETGGPEHIDVAIACLNYGTFLLSVESIPYQSEIQIKRALEILKKQLSPEDPRILAAQGNLAACYRRQEKFDEAEQLIRPVISQLKQGGPAQRDQLATNLNILAEVYFYQRRYAETEATLAQAIEIWERTSASPDDHYRARLMCAQAAWENGHRADAFAEIERAIELALARRPHAAGGDHRQARYFASFSNAFECMLAWQHDLGNTEAAFAVAERGRARALLDQMDLQHIDLLAGVAPDEAAKLQQRELEIKRHLADLEMQFERLCQRNQEDASDRQQLQAVADQIYETKKDFSDIRAEIRFASPIYQSLVGSDREPIPLKDLQHFSEQHEALILEYVLGREGGYVFVFPGKGTPRLNPLHVDEQTAETLGIDPGALTAGQVLEALTHCDRDTGRLLQETKIGESLPVERMAEHLQFKTGTGPLYLLKDPDRSRDRTGVTQELAALWRLLIPAEEREALQNGKYKRLIVVPDGWLGRLPFETLVVDAGVRPKYLLEVGPPIQYAPSATVLANLAKKESKKSLPATPPVLTVGDCLYGSDANANWDESRPRVGFRARYLSLGGSLKPLPYSAWESEWVQQVFGKQAVKAVCLRRSSATEARVRSEIEGRKLLHISCHGLMDQAHGNLFGGLALTAGEDSQEFSDDGFLTLAEIYQLNLDACELAILSACDTNVGPEQRGEGAWALSRGFLVAGSRRVVASNWLVDDQAAASLISYFCSIIAKAEAAGETPDYAEALWKAKRWVRNHPDHPEWKHPYYWGTFVLVGPN